MEWWQTIILEMTSQLFFIIIIIKLKMNYEDMDFTAAEVKEMIKTQGLENISYEELIARKNKRIKEFYE